MLESKIGFLTVLNLDVGIAGNPLCVITCLNLDLWIVEIALVLKLPYFLTTSTMINFYGNSNCLFNISENIKNIDPSGVTEFITLIPRHRIFFRDCSSEKSLKGSPAS